MVSNDLDLRERAELCELFRRLGPDAPTLCEGWTTAHLAAHLSIRERDPRSGPGILFGGPFESYTNKLLVAEMRRPYLEVVDRVGHVPMGPLRIPAVRAAISLIEYTVHHEDVRRGNAMAPRADRLDLQQGLWKFLKRMSGLMILRARIKPITLELVAGGMEPETIRHGNGDRMVRVLGEPLELVLFLYGRKLAAHVELTGSTTDVALVRAASFGI